MKKKIIMVMFLSLGVLAHAESRESFIFLSKINRLEHHLASLGSFVLIHHAFAKKYFPKRQISYHYKQYDTTMRQITLDVRGGNYHALLSRFIEAKKGIKALDESNITLDNIHQILQVSRALEEGAVKQIPAIALALTSDQNLLFSLGRMRLELAIALREYLAVDVLKPGDATAPNRLLSSLKNFKTLLSQVAAYSYWNAFEKKKIDAIERTWQVLETYLKKSHFPMVTGFGVLHLDSMIEALYVDHKPKQ